MIRIFIFFQIITFWEEQIGFKFEQFLLLATCFHQIFPIISVVFSVNFLPLHNLGIAILTQTNKTPLICIFYLS